MNEAKYMKPGSMLDISERLTAAAQEAGPDTPLGHLLLEADEIIKAATDVTTALLTQTLVNAFPPPRKARMVELTKDTYVAYCRHRARYDAPDRTAVVEALKAGLKDVGVPRVVDIPEGPELLKHMQGADGVLTNWAAGYADFAQNIGG